MTSKVLTGTYTSGYTFHAPVTTVTLAAGGYVSGDGIETQFTAHAYTVVNFGRIAATGTGFITGNGVFLYDGGKVTNGGPNHTSASITAFRGVEILSGLGTVSNFGTIAASGRSGVFLGAGGSVTNGSLTDKTATISTAYAQSVGIDCGDYNDITYKYSGVQSTITNFGTVIGGVQLTAGGSVTNGGTSDTTALISGTSGVNLLALDGGSETATVTNFGTIDGSGTSVYDFGVILGSSLGAGSSVTNGSASDRTALITGNTGVYAYGVGETVINFGTIEGASGIAVYFGVADTLELEAGSTLVGGVTAADGTINAVGGLATIKGDLANVGAIVGVGTLMVAGAVSVFAPASTISRAHVTLAGEADLGGALNVVAGGALTGRSLEVGAGDILTVSGVGSQLNVTNKATVAAGGVVVAVTGSVVQISGSLFNAGALQIRGGTLQVAYATTIGNVAFTGTTGVLELGVSELTAYETVTFVGTVSGLSTTGKSSLDLLEIPYGGGAATATYVDNGHGTGGVLTVSSDIAGQGQSDQITLMGDYIGGTWTVGDDGQGGTKVTYEAANKLSPHAFVAAMAGFATPAFTAHIGTQGSLAQQRLFLAPRA